MTALPITEADILLNASPQSFQRGREYQRGGAVLSLVRRADGLVAEVDGSEPRPYRVQITFSAAGVSAVACTCPYDWADWCKHVVAVLLAYLDQPEAIEEQPPLETTLAGLSAEDLRGVLLRLSRRSPSFERAIEDALRLASADRAAQAGAGQRRTVDGKSIRRHVRQTLASLSRMSSSEAYWHVSSVVEGLREDVLGLAWGAIEDGDGSAALAILESVTEAYLDQWEELDDSDGVASAFFADLGAAWCEALLTAQLSVAEAKGWADRLHAWADALDDDYGVGDGLYDAEAAATRAWHDAERNAKAGETTRARPSAEVITGEPVALTCARLNVLERQARDDDYLALAHSAGLVEPHARMLIRVGRVNEAVDYARRHLETAGSALSLAQLLRDRRALEAALTLAEYGMSLSGPTAELAAWLRDFASAHGRAELAVRAAVLACREQPSLDAYLALQGLAGSGWDGMKHELLTKLRAAEPPLPSGHIEIFLHEGLIADAIEGVDGSWDYRVMERVAAAAVETHPDWVIETSRGEAEAIINSAKADLYSTAVRWLVFARQAYRITNREEEWQTYLAQLTSTHARKYRLRPMLEGLRR